MKKLSTVILLLWAAGSTVAQSLSSPPSGDNQKSKIIQWIGPVEVGITYSSPDVHGPNGEDRKGKIWGDLIHYGYKDQGFGSSKAAPWRAGANENTIISFSSDVKINGKDLKAGTYGLFLGLEKDGPSTWIFSKNYSSWGSYFYNQSEDALRVPATLEDAPYTEWLTYGFDNRLANAATAYLQWENKRVPFTIEVPAIANLYVSMNREELRGSVGFDYHNFQNAAQYCADNKVNLEEALTWADNAANPRAGGVEDLSTLRTKANVLTAMGKDAEAAVVMEKGIRLPSTTVMDIHQYGRSLLASGKKEKALKIFQYNQKTHPEEKFTTYVGLARGYTAVGDKKNAIKNWEIALKNVPESQKQFTNVFEGELKKLKS
jgi:tetratricopeptide (TPR) repeat protein